MTRGAGKRLLALSLLLALCWGAAAGVDYGRCARGAAPIFAVSGQGAAGMDVYRGMGYTVTFSCDGCVRQSGFYWGWGTV